MIPAEPGPESAATGEPAPLSGATDSATPPQSPARPRRSRWPWVVLAVLAACVVVGLVVGINIGLRGDSFFPKQLTPGATRPTIVVVARVEPSPSPSARATAAAPASSTTGAGTEATAGEYIVEAGDTMRGVALKVYGDADLWPRIYQANRDLIGPNPDNLQVGMHLRIPPAS